MTRSEARNITSGKLDIRRPDACELPALPTRDLVGDEAIVLAGPERRVGRGARAPLRITEGGPLRVTNGQKRSEKMHGSMHESGTCGW